MARHPFVDTALASTPLLVLVVAHLWLFQRCVATMRPALPALDCSAPPLPTLGLLALALVELTRGSRIRGAAALLVVAIPSLLRVVSEVIN